MTAKKTAATKDASERELVVSRVFDFPRERVFEAWADPKQVVKWWGPRGFSTTSDDREFKSGGHWRHTMVGPDGMKYPNMARYDEVVPPERIVYSHGGAKEDGGDAVRFQAVVTFKDLGDGRTEVTMRSVFATAEMRETAVKVYRAVEGGRQNLERLGEHLAGAFVLSRLFDAPLDRVYRAWTEPERLAAWFGPKGFETVTAKLDFRPGGTYLYAIRSPDGKVLWGKWAFREIVPRERLVFVSGFSDEKGGVTRHPLSPDWPLQLLSTILFQDLGGKTLVTVKWVPLEPTAVEAKAFAGGFDSMRGGWGGTMDRCEGYLADLR